MEDCVKSLVTECLWPPIKCHLDYWWCFDGNVQGLSNEIVRLEREKHNMDQKIEEARLRAESHTTEVQDWLHNGNQNLQEAETILRGCDGLKAWNIISRYSWGKRAKKITEGIAKLRDGAREIRISDPAPPPAVARIPRKPTMEFESRKRVEEDIMEFLRDDRTYMIAICGAGGVGKTTMVHRIEDRVRKENLFDEVVHVVVSQQIDMIKIQMEIAEFLDLEVSEKTLAARAHKLRIRLQDSKRKLIIFDDVWKLFDPNDIGVPFENGFTKCKIILTSRITDACEEMGAKIIRMELLKEEEAWALFKEKAGSYVEGPDLRPIAENVVAECKRLPIALVTVGAALIKDKTIDVWEDSLDQLRRAMPIDLGNVIKDVYKPLKLSFDFLEDNFKNLFLLCCLFPEDYTIPIEHLTLYSFGLHMFEGIRNIEKGRSKARSVVEKLKSRFLLLDGDRRRHSVKMHDVVRDVAIFIGSKEKDGFLINSLEAFSMDSSSKDSSRHCNWMSIDISTENAKLPVGSDFPNLRFMMIRGEPNKAGDGNNVICFEGMQGLKVLSVSHVYLRSLPSTMESLKELRTLRLENCFVKDISALGELACLEVLCIHGCDKIEELPTDIGRLNVLRLLELSYCSKLKRIAAGVISSLVRLEELKIVGCFDKWEAKGNQSEERNAGLSELESLRKLTSLEIEISDCNLLAEEICLSQKIERYKIRTVATRDIYPMRECEREISLYLPEDITVGNWIRQLARSTTQSLVLRGELSTEFPVKPIKLAGLEEIIYGTVPEVCNFSQKLELIRIEKLPKLAHLWKSQNRNVSLDNLKTIYIEGCPNLCYLFSVATARSFVQLKYLVIKDCEKIEQVMLWNGMESNTDASIIVFPNLWRMTLFNLPNLVAFSQGVESIEFPKLEEMWIVNLPRLKSLLPWDLEATTHDDPTTHDDHNSPYLFSNSKNVSLGNLKSISIQGCPNLCYLFSVATARSLVQLERLEIKDCDKIEQVFWNGMESNTDASIIEFPNLQQLTLWNLPNLAAFSQGVEIIESLHQLTGLTIRGCPKLRTKIGKCPNLRFVDFSGPHQLLYSHHMIEELVISDCDTIEEILWDEIKDEGERRIIFPELKKLELRNLPCFTTFCRGVESIEFPKLERMTIGKSPRMRSLLPWDLEAATHDDHHSPYLFCNAKNVSLGNLKSILIKECHSLCYLFSVATSRSLVQLERLEIKDCDKIEQVLWNGMESNTDASIIEFPNLRKLTLSKLPNLAAFSQGVEIIESLHQLTGLTIKDCPKLRTKIGKCPNLISVNFRGSQHLPYSRHTIQELAMSNCDSIEEILWDEIKDEGERHIIFPELKKLELRNLPRLTTFCRGVEGIEFPKLKEMWIVNLPRLKSLLPWDLEAAAHDHHSPYLFCNAKNVSLGNLKYIFIEGCPNLCYLFSVATARSLVQQLERLEIEDCDKIEQVFWNGMESNTDASIIEFPNLQQLTLSKLPNLAAFSQGVEIIESLHQLAKLTIKDCPKLRTKIRKCPNLRSVNFSGSQHLPCSRHTIQELAISNCFTIEEILWDEIKDEGERHIIFPELKKLELCNLPCFTAFFRGVESIEFPKLEKMTIGDLPRMNSLLPLDLVEATHHDHHSLHFLCNPKVEIPGLTGLSLVKLHNTISKIWCRRVPINFFHNLERLSIVDVNGNSNLIFSSIAKNLVNLNYLRIEGCHEMVDVIEDEKEVFAMTPFHNLKSLSIVRSHKLRSFCQWKHALEWPSLGFVTIDDCPGMETFTLGSLSTPSLFFVYLDGKKIETKDLNGGIRDRFRIKTENKEEHEDEDKKKQKARK